MYQSFLGILFGSRTRKKRISRGEWEFRAMVQLTAHIWPDVCSVTVVTADNRTKSSRSQSNSQHTLFTCSEEENEKKKYGVVVVGRINCTLETSGAAAVVLVVDSQFSSSSAHVGVHVFTSVAKPPHLRPRIRIQPNRVTCLLHEGNRKKGAE